MRLSFARASRALPALAGGLFLGWAATAAADAQPAAAAAPPAAPIFYCPTGPAKPAAPGVHAPACPAPPPAHVAVVAHRPARHDREVRVAERHARAPHEDVSASQAFIYRYEQAQHGLDARAADEAWAHAGPPPCREPHGCPPRHEWAEAPPPPQVIVERAPPQPQQVIVERAPPPPPQVIIERAPPPPPKIIIEHPPAPPPQIVFERAPAPPQVIYERAPACPDRCPPPSPRYGYEDHAQGAGYLGAGYLGAGYRAGYSIERHESERSGGWRYSEQNGQGRYQAWGDARRRRPCPPSVPVASCGAAHAPSGYAQGGYAQSEYASGAYASGEGEWRDGSYGRVYPYSGRDAAGYLVWPGKTGQ